MSRISAPPELTNSEQGQPPKTDSKEERLPAEKRVEFYLELYKQQMAYFHETRRIEFQANLALWGAIFAVGYALAGKIQPTIWESIFFVILTGALSGVWAFFLKKTKQFDKNLFGEYRARIERLIEAQPLDQNKPNFPKEHKWYRGREWLLFYVIATLLFSFAVVYFLRAIPVKLTPKMETSRPMDHEARYELVLGMSHLSGNRLWSDRFSEPSRLHHVPN